MAKELEAVVSRKVKPIVESAMQKVLGVTIDELSNDISTKLTNPLAGFVIDPKIPFKQAKRQFKATYLQRLLKINYGNISEVAKQAAVDRRSIHRLVKGTVDVAKIRREMELAYDIKQQAISHIIEDVLGNYKNVLHPGKLDEMYRNVSTVSKDILESLPEQPVTLKEAEHEFEMEYFKQALKLNGSISQTARAVQLRYESLYRKLKRLGLV